MAADGAVFRGTDGNAFAGLAIGESRPKLGIGVGNQINECIVHGRLADMDAKSHKVLLFSRFDQCRARQVGINPPGPWSGPNLLQVKGNAWMSQMARILSTHL
jgi:hypothetical protein